LSVERNDKPSLATLCIAGKIDDHEAEDYG